MKFQVINELSFDQSIQLSDGGQIIAADWGRQPTWCHQTALVFKNHNLFRMTAEGEVVWQVRRDEKVWSKFQTLREDAERKNIDDPIGNFVYSPFLRLWLRYADGSTNEDKSTYKFPQSDHWVQGATVCCSTYDSMQYDLDIETGVAINVKPLGGRPW